MCHFIMNKYEYFYLAFSTRIPRTSSGTPVSWKSTWISVGRGVFAARAKCLMTWDVDGLSGILCDLLWLNYWNIDTDIYTHIYTHTHMYIYIYLHLFIYSYICIHILNPTTSAHDGMPWAFISVSHVCCVVGYLQCTPSMGLLCKCLVASRAAKE